MKEARVAKLEYFCDSMTLKLVKFKPLSRCVPWLLEYQGHVLKYVLLHVSLFLLALNISVHDHSLVEEGGMNFS